jgi:hypothetical protein
MLARRKPRTVTTPRPVSILPSSPVSPSTIRSLVPALFRSCSKQLRSRLLLPGLLLAWLCLNPAIPGSASPRDKRAEQPYALIYGTVWGPDGRPLYGVKVEIRRADRKKPRWELYSDHSGEFALRVPPGPADYLVSADLKGFKYPGGQLRLAQEAKVHVDNDEREDMGLHLTK